MMTAHFWSQPLSDRTPREIYCVQILDSNGTRIAFYESLYHEDTLRWGFRMLGVQR